jgi:hypothetical protein
MNAIKYRELERLAFDAVFLGYSGCRDRKKKNVAIPTQLPKPTRAIGTIHPACKYLLGRVLIKSIGGGGLTSVCFTPESGHRPTRQACPLSAKTGCEQAQQMGWLFDHLVGECE